MYPYAGRLPSLSTVRSPRPNAVRATDVPGGFPRVGRGLGGIPIRQAEVPEAWELTVAITAGGQTYTIDIYSGTGIAINTDWGDGAVERFTSTGQKEHTYNAPGRYRPKISGRFASDGSIRLGSNAGNAARLKATSIIPFIPGLAKFQSTFASCTGLTLLPTDLFRYNPQITASGFYSTFSGCAGLIIIPEDLFRYNILVSDAAFYQVFLNCTGIQVIPENLFRYNPLVSTSGFYAAFQGCTGIRVIPENLFRYNPLVSTSGFYSTFRGCTGVKIISVDLFRYNTLVSTNGFNLTFCGCTGVKVIPVDLFRYNTLVSTGGFTNTFNGCNSLETVPQLLFKYDTACISFSNVFFGCNKLKLRADLFFDTGEETTRFLNQTVNFTNALCIGTFTGTQGTAPALWSCDFGSGAATTTTCFTGHTASTVDNYASIPTAWGGA